MPYGRPTTFHATATSPIGSKITLEWTAGPQTAQGDTATFTFAASSGISGVTVIDCGRPRLVAEQRV